MLLLPKPNLTAESGCKPHGAKVQPPPYELRTVYKSSAILTRKKHKTSQQLCVAPQDNWENKLLLYKFPF